MAFPRKLKDLCTPAFIYFVVSVIGLIGAAIQNFGNSNRYNLGVFSARVPNTGLVFLVKIIYVLFWTWVLNLMCKDGHKEIAWFLVLVPFILLFVVGGLLMVNQGIEGNDPNAKVPKKKDDDKKKEEKEKNDKIKKASASVGDAIAALAAKK
jgi:hypothetical protein